MATRGELNRSIEQARKALADGLEQTARLYAMQAGDLETRLAGAERRDAVNPFDLAEGVLHAAVESAWRRGQAVSPTPAAPVARPLTVQVPGSRARTTHAALCLGNDD